MNVTSRAPGLTVRWCLPGVVRTADGQLPPGAVLWVDVDLGCGEQDLHARLLELGVSVSEQQVADLVERDEMPVLVEQGEVRNVSLVGVSLSERTGTADDVVFSTVETLIGSDWLVTCWQHGRVCSGVGTDSDALPVLIDEVLTEVVRSWVDEELTTAGDLATAHAAALTKRYRWALSGLDDRLRAWEMAFHAAGPVDHDDDARLGAQLKPLLGMVNEARRRLTTFNDNRSAASNGRWFAGRDVELDTRADHHLDRMLKRLQMLSEAIRADLELVSMEQLARQSIVARASAAAEADFDRKLGIVTAFLLVPTLIAGVFGANTRLPGGGTWRGFDAMVVLMVVSGVAVWWTIFRKKKPRPGS